jgi:phospholipid transport system substrate-binding protein
MRLTRLCAFALLSLFVLSADSAVAAAGPGTNVVKNANDTIRDLLSQKVAPDSPEEKRLAEEVTVKVRGFLDVAELGKRALRDHWDSLPAAKRDQFIDLLRSLIEKNYIKGLRSNIEYEVAYTGEQRKGDDIVVKTVIKAQRHGRPYELQIDYVLRQEGKNLRAFDVVTDGIGLVENYRNQFNKIIRKDGFDGLLARMRKKHDSM